jgi:hypothetical protein
MPYSDPEQRRRVKRESMRRARAKGSTGSTLAALPGDDAPPLTAESIAAIVARALQRAEHELAGAEHARAIAALASVALRALETRELAERLRALERAVREAA